MSNGDTIKELDRGKELDRFKELDRGKELDRAKELDRGGPPGGVVDDLFRRVSELSGLLVVAFVAPVAGPGFSARNGRGPRGLALSALARKAESRENETAAIQQQNDETALKRILAALEGQGGKPKKP